MQMMKKGEITTKFLVTVIIILFSVMVIIFVVSMLVDKEKNENIRRMQSKELNYRFSLTGYNYTKEDLKVFLEAANDCENYSFSFYESNDLISGMVYHGKYYYSTPEEDIYYNRNEKKYIKISKKDKTFSISHRKLDENKRNILSNMPLAFLNCENLKIKFLKDDNYKGFDCIVERFYLKDYNELSDLLDNEQINIINEYQKKGVDVCYDFWIEKSTGLIAKYDIVVITKDKEENKIEYDTNLTYSKLTENDVLEPDREKYEENGYKIIEE